MRAALAGLSRWLNRATGGEPGKTLCWRWAMRFGPDCLMCRFIAWVLRDPFHCRNEMAARDFYEWLKRR